MSQLHVKNHYVPECYLKRWHNPNNKVWTFKTLVAHENVPVWKPYSVSAIAYYKHLYTRIISGNESDDIETWFEREFETPANVALDKATSDDRLSPEDWDSLIRFLAVQDVRTPLRLLEHLERTRNELPKILQRLLDEIKIKSENKSLDSLLQDNNKIPVDDFPLKISTHKNEKSEDTVILKASTYAGRSTWIYSLKSILKNGISLLKKHKWTIVKPAKGYNWPTSDNPVLKLSYRSPDDYELNCGWVQKRGNIIFPIGPEHAMFVQIGERSFKKGTRFSEEITEELIRLITENAHRMIFSNTEDSIIPTYRKRIVDPSKLSKEKENLNCWHEKNTKLEQEYLRSNKNA